MVMRRTYGSYNDGCASAHALDLVGERWALIVVRELMLGAKRFVDLQHDISGISPAVLSQRLRTLEEVGIVVRRALPKPARVTVYDLTEWGHGLEAVNTALSQWAIGSPRLPFGADMSPDTLVLAMRSHARALPRAARSLQVVLALTDSRAEGRELSEYVASLDAQGTVITKGSVPDDVDARVSATTRSWKALIIGGQPLTPGEELTVEGDLQAVQALLDATRL